MKVTHRTTICSTCPLGCADVYAAEFHTDQVLMVEDITEAITLATGRAITQEEMTQQLAADCECRVVTIGRHGAFETVCEVDCADSGKRKHEDGAPTRGRRKPRRAAHAKQSKQRRVSR